MTDLTVYSSIGVRSAAEELFRRFEKQDGNRLAVTWGTAPMLVARIEAGERADVSAGPASMRCGSRKRFYPARM